MLQLAHPEVAQRKLGALRPQVCHCSFAEPKRAPESVQGLLGTIPYALITTGITAFLVLLQGPSTCLFF